MRSAAVSVLFIACAGVAPSLIAAANRGHTADLRMALDHGAAINARGLLGMTPLMWAAQMGHTEAVSLLLARGADPNVQETFNGTTALMQAASSDRADAAIVSALLAHGADTRLRDDEGATALTWALRRGDQAIIDRIAGTHVALPIAASASHPPLEPQEAMARAIAVIEQSRPKFRAEAGCPSCHHDALPAMALADADARGLRIDQVARTREMQTTAATLARHRDRYRQGAGFADIAEAPYLLSGLAASRYPADDTTAAIVRYLELHQENDGSWHATMQRVPSDGSDVALTAMAIRALQAYAPRSATIASARAYLLRVAGTTIEDLAFQALGLQWAHARPEDITPVLATIAARQRDDGGFAQRDGLASDAYATSQSIVALRTLRSSRDPVITRAVQFLLTHQEDDGSWFVPTRALRFQPFFDSGFPGGRSQFMCATATVWAVMALASVE